MGVLDTRTTVRATGFAWLDLEDASIAELEALSRLPHRRAPARRRR